MNLTMNQTSSVEWRFNVTHPLDGYTGEFEIRRYWNDTPVLIVPATLLNTELVVRLIDEQTNPLTSSIYVYQCSLLKNDIREITHSGLIYNNKLP